MTITYKRVQKQINELKPDECIYINCVGLSANAVETVRENVQRGVIRPHTTHLRNFCGEQHFDQYMNGDYIAPQMVYVKVC
ncbi:MAG: hypothetical protein IKY67_06535 [Paludibacteraceae bacterium]|nr:hypothetical protein [Paludibacteraceae bacterium]